MKEYYYAVGRRKTSVATVRLMNGKGVLTVNQQPAGSYFNNETLTKLLNAPLELVAKAGKIDAIIRVEGGGKRGQVDAIRLGLARALVEMSDEFKLSLKKAGLLTRDPREKERKKYGLKKARKAPQFSKR
ncbi:30S ribosomal protein S9 [Candidatus Saccharibacteria bacterium]|nr:30S ribosomal protein S9 [Candidatus Saccharibacteria bacterium]